MSITEFFGKLGKNQGENNQNNQNHPNNQKIPNNLNTPPPPHHPKFTHPHTRPPPVWPPNTLGKWDKT
jgi:hypothetical protein